MCTEYSWWWWETRKVTYLYIGSPLRVIHCLCLWHSFSDQTLKSQVATFAMLRAAQGCPDIWLLQRSHPILQTFVAYLAIRAAVLRTQTAANYSAGRQEIGHPWEWQHTGQNVIFLSHATAVWDLWGGALVTVPSASCMLGKHATPQLSPQPRAINL